jgi:AraC-like DNA-binding protein
VKNSASVIYGPAAWVGEVYSDLKNTGQDADALLRKAGLTRTALGKPDGHVLFSGFAEFFELAAIATDNGLYGMHLGEKADLRNMGIIWYLGVSSSTLEEAINNVERYSRTKTNYAKFELQNDIHSNTHPNTYLLNLVTLPFPGQNVSQAEEAAISIYLKAFRQWTNTVLSPIEVTFKHHRASHLKEVRKILGCRVEYGVDQLSMRFDADQIKLPITSSDSRLLRLMRKLGDDLLNELEPDTSSSEQEVIGLIVNLLSKGQAKAKVIADKLGVTERTLSRRLGDADTSFSEILAKVRHQLFLKYIKQQELTLRHITHLLGYSETSALNNAVKRWTGKTPNEVRNTI